MRLSGQFQACLFLFYEKISRAQKHSQANINQQTQLSKHSTTKAIIFREHKLLRGSKLFVLRFGAFCAREIFS